MPDNSYHLSAASAPHPSPLLAAAPTDAVPVFLGLEQDAVWVDLNQLTSEQSFRDFVNQVFHSSTYFYELNYQLFSQLLYDLDSLRLNAHGTPKLKLATAIRQFLPERHALYRTVKIESDHAEYYFEPVFLQRPGSNALEPARLDFDEFVAYLWEKGVRYGIDEAAIKSAIKNNKAARHVIAQGKATQPGIDAGIQELAPEIHRNDAPRERANGRLDLAQFKNRFPQVKK
ncbi:MAG TPA: flagellar assembly protein A, partial [Pseudomonadales bacterium]|nr:flagellar assembly protein A [Pseudomonadales bacterium]